MDLKLLEIAEFHLSGHIRMEPIGHTVVSPGDSGIVAFELDMPGFPVGLRGCEAIYAVDDLTAARHVMAFKLGAEQALRLFLHYGGAACFHMRGKRREGIAAV